MKAEVTAVGKLGEATEKTIDVRTAGNWTNLPANRDLANLESDSEAIVAVDDVDIFSDLTDSIEDSGDIILPVVEKGIINDNMEVTEGRS